jgi:Protein of unknown function (DUF2490)
MKKHILTAIFLCTVSTIFAQTKSYNNNIWLHYVGKNMLTKKLSFTLETTMRYANGFSEKQQYFIRPSLDYQLTKHFAGSLGYSHYDTYVYGSPAINKSPIPENHVWLQGTFAHQFGDLKLTNRLRDENRWVGIATAPSGTTDYSITDHKYRNRLRYMILATYPILKKDKKPVLNAFIGDEAFMNIGPLGTNITANNVGKTFMNQNRVILGLGYVINPHHQIQLSYIQQNIWNFSDTIEESNPTLRISYLTNFSFAKK